MSSSSAYGNLLIAAPVQQAASNAPNRVVPSDHSNADFQQTMDNVRAGQVAKEQQLEKAAASHKRSNAARNLKADVEADRTVGAQADKAQAVSDKSAINKSIDDQSDTENQKQKEQECADQAAMPQVTNTTPTEAAPAVVPTLTIAIGNEGVVSTDAEATANLEKSAAAKTAAGKALAGTQVSAGDQVLTVKTSGINIDETDANAKLDEEQVSVVKATSDATNASQAAAASALALSPTSLTPLAPSTSVDDAASEVAALASTPSLGTAKSTLEQPVGVYDATAATGDEPQGEAATTNPKTIFGKMLEAMTGSSHAGETGEQASKGNNPTVAQTSSTNSVTSALDSLGRAVDSQLPAGRSFVVQTSIPVTVGQPQWSQAVGEKVLWLAAQNVTAAEIRLDPPDLGPMQVKVSLNQEQASVSFTSHHAGVRELLDQNLPRLRDMFNEQGLNLVNVDVSDRSFQRHQGEAKEQHGQGGATEPVEDLTPVSVSAIVQQRLVDHYA